SAAKRNATFPLLLFLLKGSSNRTQGEESMTIMTSYRIPHHSNRFFAGAQNDVLPSAVIQHF
ncbi:hypothetical protein, partial [Dialister invisus]